MSRARGVVVGVGLDPEAIAEQLSFDPALTRMIHEELAKLLAEHGRLLFASRADLERFRARLTALPVSVAKLWEALISAGRIKLELLDPQIATGIAESLDPVELASQLADRVDLVLLEREHAELLGVPPDQFSVVAPGGKLELGRIATAARTVAFTRARELADAPIRKGDNRELIWADRFAPYVEVCKTLVVYDRYAGIQAARRFRYRASSADGLTWFLGKVAMQPGRSVKLITACRDDDGSQRMDEDVISDGLQQLYWALGEREIKLEVVLVPDGGRRFGHDRHIRFGERAVVSLGPGLQVFSRPVATETVVVGRLPIADARARERAAEQRQLRPPAMGWITRRAQR